MHHLYIFILSCICYLLICLLHSCKIDITNFFFFYLFLPQNMMYHFFTKCIIQRYKMARQTPCERKTSPVRLLHFLYLILYVCLSFFFLLTPSLYLSTISLTLSKFVCLPVSYELCLSVWSYIHLTHLFTLQTYTLSRSVPFVMQRIKVDQINVFLLEIS